MNDTITIEVSGLKCDAPNCDYYDHEAKYENYEKYVNKPCPKCGANLLTEADMRTCKLMEAAAAVVNATTTVPDGSRNTIRTRMHMNGSGKIRPEIISTDASGE